jgi:hypothetical protein
LIEQLAHRGNGRRLIRRPIACGQFAERLGQGLCLKVDLARSQQSIAAGRRTRHHWPGPQQQLECRETFGRRAHALHRLRIGRVGAYGALYQFRTGAFTVGIYK